MPRRKTTGWYGFSTTVDLTADAENNFAMGYNGDRGTVPMFYVQESGTGGISSGNLSSDPTQIPEGTLLRTFIKGSLSVVDAFGAQVGGYIHFAHWLFAFRYEESFEQAGTFLVKQTPVLFGDANALGFEDFLGMTSKHTWFHRDFPEWSSQLVAPFVIDSQSKRVLEDNTVLALDINDIYGGMRSTAPLEGPPPQLTLDCRILLKKA